MKKNNGLDLTQDDKINKIEGKLIDLGYDSGEIKKLLEDIKTNQFKIKGDIKEAKINTWVILASIAIAFTALIFIKK